jgi:predicted dehydrogenase
VSHGSTGLRDVVVTALLGVGFVGAGAFARFLAGAVADLPDVRLVGVADSDPSRAAELARAVNARAVDGWEELLTDPEVDVVAIMTPPSDHATIARAALEAGRHVWCEKPLATDAGAAADVLAAAESSGRVLVVDHVLRYNPLLQALRRLQGPLLGPLQRFAFENDASDEDLAADHWFWDEDTSGGILVEHGVHFFDAAHLLAGTLPEAVQAMSASREDGSVDLVSATTRHPGGLLAGFSHGFSHAHRCERQLMRLDHGTVEVRVDGWIPLRAVLDGWTDDAGADLVAELPQRADELFAVDGHRLGPDAAITVEVRREAGSRTAVGRGSTHVVPHHVRAELTLGGPAAKERVYAESLRAGFVDLVRCVTTGAVPQSGAREGWAAVVVADAARRSTADGRTIDLDPWPSTTERLVRTA